MTTEEQGTGNRRIGESSSAELEAEEIQVSSEKKKGAGESDGIGSISLKDSLEHEEPILREPGRPSKRKRSAHPGRVRRKKKRNRPWYIKMLFVFLMMVGLYAAAAFFLVPTFVKGPVSDRLSELTGHSVSIDNVLFSPFTLNLYISKLVLSRAGPENSRDTLLSGASIECNLSLISMAMKKSLVESIIAENMSLNLIRYQGMDFNVSRLYEEMIAEHPEYEASSDLAWLIPGQVDILNSQVVFDDKPAGKQHKIEQINFKLPPVSSGDSGRARIPKLTAVINSSPIQISAKRMVTDTGALETHLSLYSKQINLSEYLGYLPHFSEKSFLVKGSGDVNFDLIFAVNESGEKDFILKGSASLAEVLITRADNKPYFKVPSVLMALRTSPLKRQVEIEDIVLREPELYLDVQSRSMKKEKDRIEMSGEVISRFLNNLAVGVKVDRLLIDKGFVMFGAKSDKKIKNTNWKNIHLSLTGFENQKYVENAKTESKSASFLLSGVSRSGKHSMNGTLQGTLRSDLKAEGRITVKDVDLAKYQSLFLDVRRFKVAGGKISLDTMFTYQPALNVKNGSKEAKGLYLFNGSLSLRNYTIFDGRKKMLTGKGFSCAEMEVNYQKKSFFCNRLDADNNEIFSSFWANGFLADPNRKKTSWQMSINDLDLQDSVLHVEVPMSDQGNEFKKVILTEVSLKANSLQSKKHDKDNVSGSAKVAGKGELRVNGNYSQKGMSGKLQTAFKDIELSFLRPFYASWLIPDVLQGSLHGWGLFEMPVKRFKGKIWIEDFETGWEKEAVVSWKKALVTGVVFTPEPLHLGIEHVIVEQPEVHFPNKERVGEVQYFHEPKGKGLRSLNISKVDINKVSVKGGQCTFGDPLIADGFFPKLTGIEGILSSVHSNKPVNFSFKGLINDKSDFSLKGVTDLMRVREYELQVDKLPVTSFNKGLKKQLVSISSKTTLSLLQTMRASELGKDYMNNVTLHGLQPKPGSTFGDVFSMLIDEKEQVVFTQERQEEKNISKPLFDDLMLRMQRDRVKASLSPELVIQSFFPDLKLIRKIPFHHGTEKTVNLSYLDDYAIVLGRRPWLKLVLTGSYESDIDAGAMQNFLQGQAQAQRDKENRQRKSKQEDLEKAEKEKLSTVDKDSDKVVVEKIGPEELGKDLLPLPPVARIPLSQNALNNLGAKRLELVRSYMDSNLGLDGDRIELSADIVNQGAAVMLQLQPVYK